MTDQDITSAMLLEHMRGMEERLLNAMDSKLVKLRQDIKSDLDQLRHSLTAQIDAIDQRLDVIEIENLPRRVTRLEEHAGFAA